MTKHTFVFGTKAPPTILEVDQPDYHQDERDACQDLINTIDLAISELRALRTVLYNALYPPQDDCALREAESTMPQTAKGAE